jgi:FAD:protein FMN transferase
MIEAEHAFAAMGTTAHVMVTADTGFEAERLCDAAEKRIVELEERWSRFVPTSDVSRLNELATLPRVVAPETLALVKLAVEGWRMTGGLYDPTVLPALVAAGYDRSFELVGAVVRARPSAPRSAASPPACARIALDAIVGSVRLGEGVAFDPGGIGKGFAADLVTHDLLATGAHGACVNLGGDVRVAGAAPEGQGWVVEVDHPLATEPSLAVLRLRAGAVASTWRTRRVWHDVEGEVQHHLIDPRTAAPARTGLAGVCVIAGQGWRAEVLAKAAFLAGPNDGAALVARHGTAALLIDDDGVAHSAGDIERFVA